VQDCEAFSVIWPGVWLGPGLIGSVGHVYDEVTGLLHGGLRFGRYVDGGVDGLYYS
jgi:hypothetical protein